MEFVIDVQVYAGPLCGVLADFAHNYRFVLNTRAMADGQLGVQDLGNPW